jgi:hypothetical protein
VAEKNELLVHGSVDADLKYPEALAPSDEQDALTVGEP